MKKANRLISFSLIALFLLTSCTTRTLPSQDSELEGTITISGAFALYPLMTVWSQEFQQIHPEVQFDISAGGAGKGMTDTLAGAVDIGMISRPITLQEEEKGAFWVAVAKDAVFPVVNVNNPVFDELMQKGISQAIFVSIFITGEVTTWGEVVGDPTISDEIHVFTRSDACGAGDVWAKFLGNRTQDEIQGVGVNGDPGELDAVLNDALGIGYNNLGYVFDLTSGKLVDGISVIPIDINANDSADVDEIAGSLSQAFELISKEKYPSPPARLEFLATKGKPSGLTQAFIEWILTDGQTYVGTAGYVPLTSVQLEEFLTKVK